MRYRGEGNVSLFRRVRPRGPRPRRAREFYESRLKLAEAYDRAGFHIYLVAEHHVTPLGMAPSPGISRPWRNARERLRFGPLVYTCRSITRCA